MKRKRLPIGIQTFREKKLLLCRQKSLSFAAERRGQALYFCRGLGALVKVCFSK